ncbi:hypothetical protein CLF_104749 [Clonorchis sinensis]|uniref:Ig-like domain-containing protein n=1 Tax=Clonorchis sinensis TaxID=79923 RepID=G7YNZ2_CLOSI|nr:hypothetical protein CLF_104749 [Clonorchis sinensis]
MLAQKSKRTFSTDWRFHLNSDPTKNLLCGSCLSGMLNDLDSDFKCIRRTQNRRVLATPVNKSRDSCCCDNGDDGSELVIAPEQNDFIVTNVKRDDSIIARLQLKKSTSMGYHELISNAPLTLVSHQTHELEIKLVAQVLAAVEQSSTVLRCVLEHTGNFRNKYSNANVYPLVGFECETSYGSMGGCYAISTFQLVLYQCDISFVLRAHYIGFASLWAYQSTLEVHLSIRRSYSAESIGRLGFLIQLLLSFVETAFFQQNSTSLDPASAEKSVFVEALWDVVGKSNAQAAIQAGESITFLCRIWQARESGTAVSSDFTENRQSVFLYCPLSVAYCAQDCLLVEHSWPIRCTRQFRSYESYQIPSSTIRLPRSHGWELQEVIYKINIAVVGSSGLWTCSYGGINSNAVKLRVRDRPVLLSFTSNPPSPIVAGTAVNLTCEAAPSPNAPWYNFVWRRIGSRIPPVHSTVRLSDTVSVLTLTAAQSTDDGTYSCRVTRDLDSSGSTWWNDEKWKDRAIEGRQNQNKDTATSFLDNRTLTPDQLILKLDVYHPPANLTFSTDQIGPHRVGSTVTLTCRIHGGKPEPAINFYRMTAADDDSVSASHNLQYFNRSGSQNEKIRIRHGLATLSWIARREDNGIKFGCAAASVVITGRLLSSPVRLSVIFPPGPPILTAFPQSAVSENRTRIFKCRSSSGSNPPAIVKWKLYTSVDYITSSGTGNLKQPTISRALDRLLSGTKEAHVFDASEIDDFQADGRQVASAYQGTHHRDPNNQGFIAYGEARLISRPWYNGARVSCHLEWPVENVLSTTTSNANHSEEDLEYLKPAYLTTEVFFAPSIVTLSVDPRNGIQEFSGQQVIECATTSSIPQAQITWLRRRPKQVAAQENVTQSEKQAESSCCGTLEDPLETFKDDEIVEDGVNIDMVGPMVGKLYRSLYFQVIIFNPNIFHRDSKDGSTQMTKRKWEELRSRRSEILCVSSYNRRGKI